MSAAWGLCRCPSATSCPAPATREDMLCDFCRDRHGHYRQGCGYTVLAPGDRR